MKVRFSRQARVDLGHIIEYISLDNPARAQSFAAELFQKCIELKLMWNMFPIMYPHGIRPLRKRPHKKYIIFYEQHSQHINIVRILHASRNVENLLSDDEIKP